MGILDGPGMGILEEAGENAGSYTAVGIASVQLIAPKKDRQFFYIKNTDTNNVNARFSIYRGQRAAVLDAGQSFGPGEHVTESSDAGFKCHKGAIQIIFSAINGTVAFTEG